MSRSNNGGGGGFFSDDEDEDLNSGDITTTTTNGNDSFFTSASPRAYNARPAARVSSISNYGPQAAAATSSSSVRASSVYSDSGNDRSSNTGRGRADGGGEPGVEYFLGEEEGEKERNIVKLIRCWSNEIAAPEVLPFPTQLVERVVKDLARRREDVAEKGARTMNQSDGFYVELALVATENLRASHVLRAYTRERIFKIEKFAKYLLDDEQIEDTRYRLYHNELTYAEGYVRITNEYFKTAAVDAMPARVHGYLSNPSYYTTPDWSQAVLMRARRDCPTVVLPDGSTMEFLKGSQHLVRYSTIRELLMRDYVELL
ncbi:GINS complex subunit 4, partial [Phenoliferia sp. Uapishka_3]